MTTPVCRYLSAEQALLWDPQIVEAVRASQPRPCQGRCACPSHGGHSWTAAEILAYVSRETRLHPTIITRPGRAKDAIEARNLYAILAVWFTRRHVTVIGKTVHRDHSTILNAISRVHEQPDRYQARLWAIITAMQTDRLRSMAGPHLPAISAPPAQAQRRAAA